MYTEGFPPQKPTFLCFYSWEISPESFLLRHGGSLCLKMKWWDLTSSGATLASKMWTLVNKWSKKFILKKRSLKYILQYTILLKISSGLNFQVLITVTLWLSSLIGFFHCHFSNCLVCTSWDQTPRKLPSTKILCQGLISKILTWETVVYYTFVSKLILNIENKIYIEKYKCRTKIVVIAYYWNYRLSHKIFWLK